MNGIIRNDGDLEHEQKQTPDSIACGELLGGCDAIDSARLLLTGLAHPLSLHLGGPQPLPVPRKNKAQDEADKGNDRAYPCLPAAAATVSITSLPLPGLATGLKLKGASDST